MQKDIANRITLLILLIFVCFIPYVMPIPRESILTDRANSIQFNNILIPQQILKIPIKIKITPAIIERTLLEILNLLTIVVAKKLPQLTKKV